VAFLNEAFGFIFYFCGAAAFFIFDPQRRNPA
jgi:hypothetical protein